MTERWADVDERRFERPGRRSRPRTKDRPDHSEAELGLVVGVDRGRFRVRMPAPEAVTDRLAVTPSATPSATSGADEVRLVSATKARTLGRKAAIVGDVVRVVGDTSGAEGTLARIVEVAERASVLRRTADDDDPWERPVVANADQLCVVTALADPPPRTGMIDRILVAGFDAGVRGVLVLTKADLASPDALVEAYRDLDLEVVVVDPDRDLTGLRELLAGSMTVFVGHSGVGKSTLVNRLIPGLERATGEVNEVTGRGRHTSTSAVALELPRGEGWVIDTPGVRSFGLHHVEPASLVEAFADLAAETTDCPRGCRHTGDSPGCALDAAAAAGRVSPRRLASFRRVLEAVPAH